MTTSRRRRRILIRIAAAGFGILVAATALEIGLRLWIAVDHPPIRALDATLGWSLIPDARRTIVNEDGEAIDFVVNADGLRGPRVSLLRTPGVERVLVLGDSFTEAGEVPLDAAFATRLIRTDREVVNAGVGGYGTVQEALWLRERGLTYDPDVVVVACYANDLVDNCRSHYPAIGPRPHVAFADGNACIVEELTDDDFRRFLPAFPGAPWWHRHSALFRSFEKNVWQPLARERLQRLDRDEVAAIPTERRESALFHALGEIHALCGDRRLVVLMIPTRDEVSAGAAPMHERITAWADARGIATCPLLAPLVAATAAGERCYFATDIHWTAAGHRIAAAELETMLDALR